jgi:hypothetical protein
MKRVRKPHAKAAGSVVAEVAIAAGEVAAAISAGKEKP